MMKIVHFFNIDFAPHAFDTYAEVLAFEAECGCKGEVMEVWQTEDGEVFLGAAEAEGHALDNAAPSFDWDGFNMKGVELLGAFA